jgi:hypothetical protein
MVHSFVASDWNGTISGCFHAYYIVMNGNDESEHIK